VIDAFQSDVFPFPETEEVEVKGIKGLYVNETLPKRLMWRCGPFLAELSSRSLSKEELAEIAGTVECP